MEGGGNNWDQWDSDNESVVTVIESTKDRVGSAKEPIVSDDKARASDKVRRAVNQPHHESFGPMTWKAVDKWMKDRRGGAGPSPCILESRNAGRDSLTMEDDKKRYRAKRAKKRKEAGITLIKKEC